MYLHYGLAMSVLGITQQRCESVHIAISQSSPKLETT